MNKQVYLQDLFSFPVNLSVYEVVLLRKLKKNEKISKKELDFLLEKELIIEKDSQYYFAKGVVELLERAKIGKTIGKKRRIKNGDRQESDS